jgi:hypothetical protein
MRPSSWEAVTKIHHGIYNVMEDYLLVLSDSDTKKDISLNVMNLFVSIA